MILKITNNLIFVYTEEKKLKTIQDNFRFKDTSDCLVGGFFDITKIKTVNFLKIKNKIGILPIGFLNDLLKLTVDSEIIIEDKRKYNQYIYLDKQIKTNLKYLDLYPEQIECIKNCFKSINGIIKAPTGFGKNHLD